MIAPPITRMAHTVDSSPVANPDRIVVAGPVNDDSAISLTGLRLVEVKCSVKSWITLAGISPNATAQNVRRSFVEAIERRRTPMAGARAGGKKPRVVAFLPCSGSLL